MPRINQSDWSPSDWPEWLPELRRIDNLLRCSICYEYFETAVLFSECSHNYCSLCIRKAMVYDPQCPTCFEKMSSNDLKCNRVLDQLVKNFVNVRYKLLDLIKKAKDVQSDAPEKKGNIEMSDDSASNFEVTPRRLRMNLKSRQKSKKGKSPLQTPRNKRKRPKLVNSDSDGDDSEDATECEAMAVDPVKSPIDTNSQHPDDVEAPTSFVECPVCRELISSNTINIHLDLCLISGEKKSSLRSRRKSTKSASTKDPVATSSSGKSPPRSHSLSSRDKMTDKIDGANTYISAGPKRKTIPGTVYAILSDKQLKQKLKEWNLSTQGNRKTLIKRHQEFVVAYNAQCDSLNPKPVSAIVKELEIKEKRKFTKLLNTGSAGPVSTTNLNLNRDASEEEVDKAHKQYLQENKGQFEKLIEQIKKRKKQGDKSDEKSKTSVVIIDDDSEQGDRNESENNKRLQPKNQEIKNNSSEDDDDTSPTDKKVFKLDLDLSSKIKSEEPDVPHTNIVSVKSQECDSKTSKEQPVHQLKTEDPKHPNVSKYFPVKREDEMCSAFQGTKIAKQVPDPPFMDDLASISESDSSNEDNKEITEDDVTNDDGDDTSTDDTTDETNDDIKNDQDCELTPSFDISNTFEEEFNENGESDEDLFATTPRSRQPTKARSLRRKKR